MTKPKPIAIDLIRIDAGTQFRAAINQDRVTDYAELFDGSKEWPFDSACEVFFDGVEYFLVDGFHRHLAAVRVKRSSLSCIVHRGTQRDAIKFALSANARHGLHRSNEDKRKAVYFAFDDSEWSTWSSRAIAEICGVSYTFVENLRKMHMVTSKIVFREDESVDNGCHLTGKDGKKYPAKKPKADPKPEPKQAEPEAAKEPDAWEDVDDTPEPQAKPEQAETPQALQAPIQAVASQLNPILKQLEKLADETGGEWIGIQDLTTQINQLKFCIRQSVYWVECPECDGKKTGCRVCNKIGWLSLSRKGFLTQAHKDKLGLS